MDKPVMVMTNRGPVDARHLDFLDWLKSQAQRIATDARALN